MNTNRTVIIDGLLVVAVTVLVVVTLYSVSVVHVSRWVAIAAVTGLALAAVALMVGRFSTRPDHLRAMQSHKILEIANETLPYLREGLTQDSAQAVCRIVLKEAEAAAVAITDAEQVLGFAGLGEDHHSVGGPIITRATHDVLEHDTTEILSSREEIGCPKPDCVLQAAIVVPLNMRDQAVGTLKFYYTTPHRLNETQVAMAEGLAKLLSTQLEVAELDRQTELATRMELKALQAQINPHFLFNTINTIASLMRTDPVRARELLREFAAFYRRFLESGEELIPLSRELEHTRRYLSFEQARFGDRLLVVTDIEPSLLDMLVPAFIVQPLVENSVAHGMGPQGPLTVRLTAACRRDGAVEIVVTDDGVGIPADILPRVLEPGFGKGLGIALKNVDDRLKGHFGPGSGVHVESTEGHGTAVSLLLETPMSQA